MTNMTGRTATIEQVDQDTFTTVTRDNQMTLKRVAGGWEMRTTNASTRAQTGLPSIKKFSSIDEVESRYRAWGGITLLIDTQRPLSKNGKTRENTTAGAETPIYDMLTDREKAVLAEAKTILSRLMERQSDALSSSCMVKELLVHQIGHLPHEVFGVLHLDNANRVIKNEELFRGSISHTAVYPREVAKSALLTGSASVVLYHNHPAMSSATPSRSDQELTNKITTALGNLGIVVLDHIVVSGTEAASFVDLDLMPATQH